MYVCRYVYIYIYIYTHMYTHTSIMAPRSRCDMKPCAFSQYNVACGTPLCSTLLR